MAGDDGKTGFAPGEIDGATPIVIRALGGIGYKVLFVVGGGIPKHLGDVPRAIGVMDKQAVSVFLELAVRSNHGFSRRPL